MTKIIFFRLSYVSGSLFVRCTVRSFASQSLAISFDPQGMAIGNGFIDPLTLQRYSYFTREAGLVDDRVADVMKHLESAVVQFINNGEMLKAYAVSNLSLWHSYPSTTRFRRLRIGVDLS